MKISRLSLSHLKPVLLALTLAGAVAVPAHSADSLHEFLKPRQPLDPAQAKEQRKQLARADAEKKRALREAKEREAAEKGADATDDGKVIANHDDGASEDDADSTKDASAAAKRFSSEAGVYIEAAVRRFGLSPSASAQTAGLMMGVSGPWVFSHLMGPQGQGADALDILAQDATSAGVEYLEQRYSAAERIGHYIRYALILALAGSAFIVGYRTMVPASGRRSRLSAPPRKESMLKLPRFFGGKKPATQASVSQPGVGVPPLDAAMVEDYAVNLLFARGRHDLGGCRNMITPNLMRILETYFRTCESRGHWNKVERVSKLQCQVQESWEDGDAHYTRLTVTWQALDYVVNLNRKPTDPGYIVEGNPVAMDPFSEDWTAVHRAGDGWLIDSMCPSAAAPR